MPGVRVPPVRERRDVQAVRCPTPERGGSRARHDRDTCRGVAARAAGTSPGPRGRDPGLGAATHGSRVRVTGGRAAARRAATGGREHWNADPARSEPRLRRHRRADPARRRGAAARTDLHRLDGPGMGDVQPRARPRPAAHRNRRVRGRERRRVLVARPHVRRGGSRRRRRSSSVRFPSRRARRPSTSPRCRPTTTRSSPEAWCCRSRFRTTGSMPCCTRS